MRTHKNISDQIEHDELPFMDDLNPEPSPAIKGAGYIGYVIGLVLAFLMGWLSHG